MFLGLVFLLHLTCSVDALWPQPTLSRHGTGSLWLNAEAPVLFDCNGSNPFDLVSHPLSPGAGLWSQSFHSWCWRFWQWINSRDGYEFESGDLNELQVLGKAAQEMRSAFTKTRFQPWKLHPRHAAYEPDHSKANNVLDAVVIHQMACPNTESLIAKDFFDGDELYTLTVEKNVVTVQSKSTLGTIRAFQTLTQLVYAHSKTEAKYMPGVPLHIEDKPMWKHRGLSLDIARNVIGPESVRRTIDAMASIKLSRLHIHATDSQSWPIEVLALPELAAKGAYYPAAVWSVSQLRSIQRYGLIKGISVFVEIDMPGHTASVSFALPELVAAYNEPDWSTFAAEPQSGQLKLNSSEVDKFVDDLLEDLLPRVAPYTGTYHAGGDEVNEQVYLLDETVQTNDTRVLQPLVQRFFDKIVKHVQSHGLRLTVWEEMVLDWNLTLPRQDTLIQVWRDSAHIDRVLRKGYHVLFGDYKHWYLDCGFGGFINPYPTGKSPSGIPFNTSGGMRSRIRGPYLDYCQPYKNWRHVYMYDPLVNISNELYSHIEGGEVLLWSELTDDIDLDFKLWPRVAAAAEVLWSGPRNESMLHDATGRLGEWRERVVVDVGVSSSPVQMTWCLMEGGCSL